MPFTAIHSMTGLTKPTVAKIVTQLQTAIMDDCKANPPVLGSPGSVVEIDETEVGRKKKGVRLVIYSHHAVCHKDGDFVSKCDHAVHTNSIDGCGGVL